MDGVRVGVMGGGREVGRAWEWAIGLVDRLGGRKAGRVGEFSGWECIGQAGWRTSEV
jgi:hypothetical protein